MGKASTGGKKRGWALAKTPVMSPAGWASQEKVKQKKRLDRNRTPCSRQQPVCQWGAQVPSKVGSGDKAKWLRPSPKHLDGEHSQPKGWFLYNQQKLICHPDMATCYGRMLTRQEWRGRVLGWDKPCLEVTPPSQEATAATKAPGLTFLTHEEGVTTDSGPLRKMCYTWDLSRWLDLTCCLDIN